MKSPRLLCLLIVLLCFSSCAAINPIRLYFETKLPPAKNYAPVNSVEKMVKMRSGDYLHTVIFSTDDDMHPCLLVRIPLFEGIKYNLFRQAFGSVWANRGYTVVIQNVRGFAPSEGNMEPFIHERSDGEDTINWLTANQVCGDYIYSWGGSYFGLTQWAVGDLSTGPKAIQISSPRLKSLFYHGGAFALSTALFWVGRNENLIATPGEIDSAAALGPDKAEERLLGKAVPYYRQWWKDGSSEDYWRDTFPNAGENMKGPVLLMGGWYDPFLPGMLEDFQQLKQRKEITSLVIGPWAHAETVRMADGFLAKNYRLESIERPLYWFDQLSTDNIKPKVEIFLMGENRWITMDDYPPPWVKPSSWQLDFGDKSLSRCELGDCQNAQTWETNLVLNKQDPTPAVGGIELGQNFGPLSQDKLQTRPDVFSLFSAPLTDPLTLIGSPTLSGTVAIAQCRSDLVAVLVDRFPDGTSYLITEGVHRFNSSEKLVSVSLRPTGYVVKAGHSIGIQITPASYPKYDLPDCVDSSGQALLSLQSGPSDAWILQLPNASQL